MHVAVQAPVCSRSHRHGCPRCRGASAESESRSAASDARIALDAFDVAISSPVGDVRAADERDTASCVNRPVDRSTTEISGRVDRPRQSDTIQADGDRGSCSVEIDRWSRRDSTVGRLHRRSQPSACMSRTTCVRRHSRPRWSTCRPLRTSPGRSGRPGSARRRRRDRSPRRRRTPPPRRRTAEWVPDPAGRSIRSSSS